MPQLPEIVHLKYAGLTIPKESEALRYWCWPDVPTGKETTRPLEVTCLDCLRCYLPYIKMELICTEAAIKALRDGTQKAQ